MKKQSHLMIENTSSFCFKDVEYKF